MWGKALVASFMNGRTFNEKVYSRMARLREEKRGFPSQPRLGGAGANDAGAIAPGGGGVRPLAGRLPCRYLHSAFSMISLEDFHHAEELVKALAERIALSPPEIRI